MKNALNGWSFASAVPILNSPWWRDPVCLLIILAACPFLLDSYRVSSLASYFPYAMAASALALVWGYCGILALGQAAFFGLGAYAAAKGIESYPVAPGLVAGIFIGCAAAGALAWILARVSFGVRAGAFLISVMTFCTAVAFEQLALKFTSVTGGQNGIPLDRVLPKDPLLSYYIGFVVFAMLLLGMAVITRSNLGRVIASVRDDSMRIRFFGTNAELVQRRVFVLGAIVTAFAGVLDALYSQIAAPDRIGFAFSTFIVLWCAIGGRNSLAAAAFGALLVNMVSNELSGIFLDYWQILLALIFIIVVMFLPDGLYWPIRVLGSRLNAPRPLQLEPAVASSSHPEGPAFVGEKLIQRFGSFTALDVDRVSFDFGHVTALIGPNGAGKSTLIAFLSGALSDAHGKAILVGKEMLGIPIWKVARLGVKRKFQNPRVFESLSVADNLFIGARDPKLRMRDWLVRDQCLPIPEDVMSLARQHGLLARLNDDAGSLAHGQKQFLEVCMVLGSQSQVVLLDEPTAGMESADRAAIGQVLVYLARSGAAVLIVEHDFDFVRSIADRILVLDQGALIADGTVSEVSEDRKVRDLYLGEGG
ncbi:MAG: ATP-binding cassette domain-containing protein [Candidatus Nanopelagicales bacterium]|nr:ATP-binding cassette domain-containing protein [Candidatus Nanopelagicales bacterium]